MSPDELEELIRRCRRRGVRRPVRRLERQALLAQRHNSRSAPDASSLS
jgi:hypothetical protein